jgi:hypothetical protein
MTGAVLMININYTEAERQSALKAESGAFELVAEGTYQAVLESVELKESKAGAPMVVSTYKIREDVNQEHRGAQLTDYLVADKTTKQFNQKRVLNYLIQNGMGNNVQFDSIISAAKSLVGQRVAVKVKIVDSAPDAEGKTFKNNRIVNVNPSMMGSQGTTAPQGVKDEIPF